ncbi:unnamed protein product [Cyprideis torosa]|uniref:Uncharacterized protein n=1 Tax=Cyprideis torosa TaxID=163714 RepID=A0A7R8WPA2_9CRUS|nr:unnamed protein product [Cyprideis torosa]CAG0904871.1 unnamed protein product [Cyprideis torosa]
MEDVSDPILKAPIRSIIEEADAHSNFAEMNSDAVEVTTEVGSALATRKILATGIRNGLLQQRVALIFARPKRRTHRSKITLEGAETYASSSNRSWDYRDDARVSGQLQTQAMEEKVKAKRNEVNKPKKNGTSPSKNEWNMSKTSPVAVEELRHLQETLVLYMLYCK